MNEQLIDTVIAPQTDAQVENLKKILNDLDIQMIENIKTANILNSTVLNSNSFTSLNKNAAQCAVQLEKVQQAQNKTAQTTIALNETQAKAAAAQQARDDKAAAQLEQKMAKQAAADAKQIAAAEAKAAKLQAIQDEQTRKANVQFPDAQEKPNPVTTDDSPAVRYEPVITGNEDMSATAVQSTEAIAAENAALLEQQEVLGSLTTAQRANIETLLALQAERAENAAELKALNVEDAASGERAVFLTSEQIRLKIAIQEVSVALNRQTKEALAADGAMVKLDQSVLLLRTAYEQLSIAERESEQGQAMLAELNALDAENKKLALSTGNTTKQIGDYEKGQGKASVATALADKVTNQFTRSLIRMGVQFLLIGVAFKFVEMLYDYIKALEIFNPIADATARAQKGLSEAFESSDYSNGIEGVEKLASDLDLVKKGLVSSDDAINQYNETIGKTFGYVNNLNDAQQGFIDHKNAYITALLEEAAANAILADSGKELADIGKKIQDIRNLNDRLANNTEKDIFGNNSAAQAKDNVGRIASNNRDIADLEKRRQQIIDNTIGALDNVGSTKAKKDNTGTDPAADLRNKTANDALERQKILAQNLINNEKLSYSTRLKAAEDFYNASTQIEKNNEATKLNELPKNDARREDIQKDADNKLLQMQISYNDQVTKLNDERYKQEQEILKNNIEKQKDLFKQVSEDPNQSYDMKLIALKFYQDKSIELIKATYREEVTEAGKNSESIKIAKQNEQKAILQLENDTAEQRLKIQKENIAKLLEQSKESEQDQLETLDNGSKLAMRVLTEAKDAKINALSLERAQGKISEQKYNEDLLAINDAYNIQRIQQELTTQQTILAIKEGNRDATALRMKLDGSKPEDIQKFVKSADKDIQPTKDKISDLTDDLGNANSKQTVDQTKSGDKDKDAGKKLSEQILEDTIKGIDEIDKLRQRAFEAEISRLEKQGAQIEINANNEKLQVQNSIASNATKAREIAVIDAQAAAQKQALQAQINKEKHKEDIAEKEATIAKIAIEGALAIVKAAPNPVTIALTAGLVALELATAVAQPLPTYAKGTKNYPGGFGIWGEAGMEKATLPDGSVQFSNGAALANFPKGTVITPHMELMQQIRPAPVKYAGAEQVPWREMIKAIKDNKTEKQRTKIVVNVDNGFEQYKRAYLNGKA